MLQLGLSPKIIDENIGFLTSFRYIPLYNTRVYLKLEESPEQSPAQQQDRIETLFPVENYHSSVEKVEGRCGMTGECVGKI